MIYVLSAREIPIVKIGYTRSATSRRVYDLVTGGPWTLTIVALVDGEPADERALHKRFDSGRLRGEWFHVNAALEEWLTTLPAAPAIAVRRSDVRRPKPIQAHFGSPG